MLKKRLGELLSAAATQAKTKTKTKTKTSATSQEKTKSPNLARAKAAKPRTTKRKTGDDAEEIAADFLCAQGFTLIERNFFCRCGELDLIMLDNRGASKVLVFVEVRYRRHSDFGGGLESITPHKQAKLRRTAQLYLLKHRQKNPSCRFDVICISDKLQAPKIEWLENAF